MVTEQDIREVGEAARQIRRDVVRMIHLAGDGHPGPALSVADILAALYFKILRVKPADPHWRDATASSFPRATPARPSTPRWPDAGSSLPRSYPRFAASGRFSRDTRT